MKLDIVPFAVLLANFLGTCNAEESVQNCFLRAGDLPKKPFPSLTQCYKNNQDACCVSAHDATIEAEFKTFLSDTCLREYSHLEHYFCLGCNPQMNKYIQWYNATTASNCASGGANCEYFPYDKNADSSVTADTQWQADQKHGMLGMVKMCTQFIDSLLFDSGDDCTTASTSTCPVNHYDNCGLILPPKSGGSSSMGALPSAYFVDGTGKPDYKLFLETVRPPFFGKSQGFHIGMEHKSGYTTTSADGGDFFYEKWTSATCFNAAPQATASVAIAAAVMLAHAALNYL